MPTESISAWLETHGLRLCAFHWKDLPDTICELIQTALPQNTNTTHTQLLLLSNAGPNFWRCLQGSELAQHAEPVDAFSLSLATNLQQTFIKTAPFVQLYPTPIGQQHIPLMRLGGLAGWNIPSPLGLGLDPQFGPWSAYRVAWLTQATELPKSFYVLRDAFKLIDLDALQRSAELCVSCDAPCEAACPANAVTLGESFNIQRCYEHRQPEHSACHTHCFARKACPIGSEYQYDDAQLAHHMSMTWR